MSTPLLRPREPTDRFAGSTARTDHAAATLARGAVVAATCLLAALAATWPLALDLRSAIPAGAEHEATVPVFSLWGLWWTADRAAHGLAGYWDAPFFHPASGVTTYSEPFPLIGLAVAPLWGLDLPPALIYNVALLGVLALNGVFGYRLARALGCAAVPALLGGVLVVSLPYVAKVEGALPLAALFGIPWTLEGLVRFGRGGRLGWALWAAAGLVATDLTCQQYLLLFAPLAIAAGLVALAQRRVEAGSVRRLAAAAVCAALVLVPVVLPGLRVHAQAGFSRPEALVEALSARPADFLTRPELALVPFPPADPGDTGGLFPGALLLALALGGAIVGARDPVARRWALYLVGSVAVAAMLALALHVDLAGWRPFATLRAIVPGFGELRAPARAVVILQLALAILAAFGLARAWATAGRRRAALVALVGLLAAGENLAVPARLVPVPASPRTAWTDFLRAEPEGTVVAHVPFPAGLHVSAYEVEAWRMFAQIDHRQPIVNGYSSNFPRARTPLGVVPIYSRFQLAMAEQFPSEPLLCALASGLDVTTLVVDRAWLAEHAREMDAQRASLEPVYADNAVQIYHLRAPPGACRAE